MVAERVDMLATFPQHSHSNTILYNRGKSMAYKFPDKINYLNFFKFRKDLVTAGNSIWRGLPKSTKSIYPVIGCYTDKHGVAFPSQQTIADLCGCTSKTVRDGIQGLLKIPWVELKNKITSRGTTQKIYTITPPNEDTKYFSFYRAILDSGIWRELSTQYNSKAAHAVYCTCMAYAKFDFGLYAELEDVEDNPNVFFEDDQYPNREYDFLYAELDVIAHKSGVTNKTAKKAIQALIEVKLLEEIQDTETQTWKIYRSPSIFFKREYLNECLAEKQPEDTEFIKCGGLGVYTERKQDQKGVRKKLPTKKVEF